MKSVTIELTEDEIRSWLDYHRVMELMGHSRTDLEPILSKLKNALAKIDEITTLQEQRDRYKKVLEQITKLSPNSDECYWLAKEALKK